MPRRSNQFLFIVALVITAILTGTVQTSQAGHETKKHGTSKRDKDQRTKKKNKTEPAQEVCDVGVLDYDDFFRHLSEENAPPTFTEALQSLLARTSHIQTNDPQFPQRWELWLNVPAFQDPAGRRTKVYQNETWYDLRISEISHDSQVAELPEMLRLMKLNTENPTYFRINLSEQLPSGDYASVLDLVIEHDGNYGELYYIEKGSSLSGTQLFGLFQKFRRYLRVKNWVLLDNSEYTLPRIKNLNPLSSLAATEFDIYPMRTYLPLISQDGKAWYEHMGGFVPLDFDHLAGKNGSYYPQRRGDYYAAVAFLRNLSLQDLAAQWQGEARGTSLAQLVAKYFAPPAQQPPTLSDLAQRIYRQVRITQGSAYTTATHDFKLLMSLLSLDNQPTPIKKKLKGEDRTKAVFQKTFVTALTALYEHRVWVLDDAR